MEQNDLEGNNHMSVYVTPEAVRFLCGKDGTRPDPALPSLCKETITKYVNFLEDHFEHMPETLTKSIDYYRLRIAEGPVVYGGAFIAILLNTLFANGYIEQSSYEQWGISWFPTYGDLLDLCRQFLAAEAGSSAEAA